MIKDGTKSAIATTTNPPGKVRNNQLFRVSQSSPLYSFLASKNAILPGGVTVLGLVLSLTKSLIKTGKHYDEKNPSIILCSQQLENVFGMKALHVKQVMPALYKAMVPLNDEEDVSEDALVIDEDVVSSDEIAPTSCPPTTSKSANEEPKSANVDEPKYTMSVELAQLLLPNQPNRAKLQRGSCPAVQVHNPAQGPPIWCEEHHGGPGGEWSAWQGFWRQSIPQKSNGLVYQTAVQLWRHSNVVQSTWMTASCRSKSGPCDKFDEKISFNIIFCYTRFADFFPLTKFAKQYFRNFVIFCLQYFFNNILHIFEAGCCCSASTNKLISSVKIKLNYEIWQSGFCRSFFPRDCYKRPEINAKNSKNSRCSTWDQSS